MGIVLFVEAVHHHLNSTAFSHMKAVTVCGHGQVGVSHFKAHLAIVLQRCQ